MDLTPNIQALLEFDTCTIANAVEGFGLRLRNEGFTEPGLRCLTEPFPRLLGYAATFRTKCADPPPGGGYYLDRTDWWGPIQDLPAPRIAVFQDLDGAACTGSSVGEVHAAILKAFGCAGVITNGAVRDIPAVSEMNFPMFAEAPAVSHSYMHLIDFGHAVEIHGLKINPGDLLYADVHGVISIPPEIAADLPEACRRIREREKRVVALCKSPDFSSEKLLDAIGGGGKV